MGQERSQFNSWILRAKSCCRAFLTLFLDVLLGGWGPCLLQWCVHSAPSLRCRNFPTLEIHTLIVFTVKCCSEHFSSMHLILKRYTEHRGV